MHIKINEDYNVVVNTALLGYVGETNARSVTFDGLTVDGADRYVLTIDYGDGVQYEVDITGGQWTPTADILRSAQTVSCQICAKKLSGQEYILVKKSRIFRLRIGAAIGDNAVPSPSVAADALDKIDAIGRQAAQAQQTAVTAAETATTSAENAKKSATAAEKSADTATQAASRAETAKTAAETSATQAETAMQGAETARTEAVTSQNAAKVSAAQAATSAQQTTADKNITAGYAKTAKTCADSTTADRQAVQDMAEQVTADKATVADHATKVAEDRTAAETAAQTAQSIADSLPDDYVTAVGKIAENTAEISAVKLSEKELQRMVNALYDMGQGITHQFETDTDTAYAKTVPTGGKLMSVKSIGGHSEVIDGEIVSAGVTEVVEQGKNLFDIEKCVSLVPYYGFEIDTNKTLKIALKDEKSCPTGVSFGIVYIFHDNTMANWLITSKGVVGAITDSSTMVGATQVMVACYPGNKETMQSIADAFDIMLVDGIYKSDTMPAYTPYHRNAHKIPEAIKALPGYGWSAGTAKNYVDYENKRYVQCVNSVDLGTLTWTAGESVSFKTHHLAGQKLTKSYSIAPNFICPKYSTKTQNESWGKTSITGISATSNVNGYIYVNDTSYTDAAAFKQAMSGVMLYYELANPIITDISTLIPDDFLRNIEVEAGGSVTFKNRNDSYRIPVPSEEEYIVKLSEVGGTT
ncbi:hypothetical protein [Ruminococcus sp.]|uniref:hypothetical protein n=1 Tax=Ruminococcus sp. TaxID=41978 RepID=UPI003AB26C99